MSEKQRRSNLELLRIVSIFMIVLHHCMVHGIFAFWHENSVLSAEINNWLCLFMSSGGKVGVSLFVLLTGYFCCKKEFSAGKWINVYLQTFLISVIVWCLFYLTDRQSALSHTLKSFLPFSYDAYWFVSDWLLLYLFSPVLNLLLLNIKRTYLCFFLAVLSIYWVVIPSLFTFDITCSSFIYFLYLYLLGGALRLKAFVLNKGAVTALVLAASICFIDAGLKTVNGIEIYLGNAAPYFRLNSIYTLFVSLSLFYLFANLKIENNRIINYISASMFGVYLIHDNDLVRPFLWNSLLHVADYMWSPYFVFKAAGVSFMVMICCVALDKCYYLIFGNFAKKIFSQINDWLSSSDYPKKAGDMIKHRLNGNYNAIIALFLIFLMFKPFLSGRYFVLSFTSEATSSYQVKVSAQTVKNASDGLHKNVVFDVFPEQKHVAVELPFNKIHGIAIELRDKTQSPIINDIKLSGKKVSRLPLQNFDRKAPFLMKYNGSLDLKGKKYYNFPIIGIFLLLAALIVFYKKVVKYVSLKGNLTS